jgi:hypothetical protein
MGTRYSNDSFQLFGTFNGGTPMASAVTLRCLTDIEHNLGISTVGPDSGAAYDETRFIGEKKPELSTSVAALSTLLGLVNLTGQNCLTAGANVGAAAFMQGHSVCAANSRVSGSTNQKVTVAKGQVLITSIGGNRGATVYAKVRLIELSTDGSTDPDAIVYNVALPSSPVIDEEFVIGGTTVIGGISIADEHLLGWTLDTGINISVIVPAGSVVPTAVDITKIRPRWRIQHDDTSLCASGKIPTDGIACTHANTKFFLQKRTVMGGLVLPATASHIKITAAGYATHSKRYQASGSSVGTGEIMIEGTEGVGGVTMTATPGVAIA